MSSVKYDTLLDPDFTFTLDKYSCVRAAWFPHIIFSYFVFLSGIAAMVMRALPPRIAHYHIWVGRFYIQSMIWTMATAFLINNTGLPVAVLVSFVWVLGGLTLGWVVINIAQVQMQRKALANITASGKPIDSSVGLEKTIAMEKGRIAGAKTFWQRVISLKTLHGALFFTSWINIAGRIFASNQSGDFTCYTYPYYKQIDTPEFAGANASLTAVPAHNPDYDELPWAATTLPGWGVILVLCPFFGSILIGAGYTKLTMYLAEKKKAAQSQPAGEAQVEMGK